MIAPWRSDSTYLYVNGVGLGVIDKDEINQRWEAMTWRLLPRVGLIVCYARDTSSLLTIFLWTKEMILPSSVRRGERRLSSLAFLSEIKKNSSNCLACFRIPRSLQNINRFILLPRLLPNSEEQILSDYHFPIENLRKVLITHEGIIKIEFRFPRIFTAKCSSLCTCFGTGTGRVRTTWQQWRQTACSIPK